ncbi:MAG: hypothetical protein L3K23_06165 [Thermoplasmata archaeon]|nr:hypothetical protein [Thermoplasmata archaeon]
MVDYKVGANTYRFGYELSAPHNSHADAYCRNLDTGRVVSQEHHVVSTNFNSDG